MCWFAWIRALFATACLRKDIDLRRNIPIILSQRQRRSHKSRPEHPYSIHSGFLGVFPTLGWTKVGFWTRCPPLSSGDGGGTKWKEMEFLVGNINISRNVPNCWKEAFTNGEKISKEGEKPLFSFTDQPKNLYITFEAQRSEIAWWDFCEKYVSSS